MINTENECACACAEAKPKGLRQLQLQIRTVWNRFKWWIRINIWSRFFYRRVMRVLHRFDLHYMPASIMSPKYGKQEHWCQWCGLRGSVYKIDPNKPLTFSPPNNATEPNE